MKLERWCSSLCNCATDGNREARWGPGRRRSGVEELGAATVTRPGQGRGNCPGRGEGDGLGGDAGITGAVGNDGIVGRPRDGRDRGKPAAGRRVGVNFKELEDVFKV